ncbi:30S ribosomal protein S18 [Mycoplasmopsis canis UFG4]|uniref:Small ribosomal subunit protein bS18 n=2 Tax=Mycoplasmopsis canis TaxID=29555 RepID=I1A6Q7_9BACT|nr:30S ribosomal protein S18 [Mycoplasmopsis canis]AKF41188.1 30S ribosomal protein S18 [Mycoplasmopsis canis]AMD81300.1 30S ribosomal protein S18 [Mycoplasmopsis canis PG 14]EIE40416.1 30S ribosomal protein S18 [Mycoplasmopsis canis UF31]EIE40557.1 30S ribosomal protein S18 [Mycoplasmopsis canis PG 14]EIE40700.1 30S ribosomal protein S18 [Mycoplasmopsis canis UF33]
MSYIKRKKAFVGRKKVCSFCEDNIHYVDYKDTELLNKFISSTGQIKPKSITGTCAKHQRKVANAVKRARFIALIPYTIVRTRSISK